MTTSRPLTREAAGGRNGSGACSFFPEDSAGIPSVFHCPDSPRGKHCSRDCTRGREMRNPDVGFDHDRYRKLLSEAVDEKKRLAFIELLIEEQARDRLKSQRAADRDAMTAVTIARVLGASRI
jgi:hypothetical protein